MTSVTHDATGKYWPVGLKRATMLGAGGKMRSYPMAAPHGPDPQRSYYTTTTGHDPRQISHRVQEIKPSETATAGMQAGGRRWTRRS